MVVESKKVREEEEGRWSKSGKEGGGDKVVDGRGDWEKKNEEKGGRGVGNREGGREEE